MNTIIEKIRAEIERRYKIIYNSAIQLNDKKKRQYYTGASDALKELLPILDTIGEKSENPINQEELDDAIDKWLYGCQIIERKNGRVYFQHKPSFSDYQNDWKNEGNAGGADLTADGLRDIARHFAQWGAEHLKK